MAVHIRLARHGAKKSPFYRVVVTDHRNPRDGRFIETVGTYNPTSKPEQLKLDQGRIDYWKSQGAKASETVERLLKKAGTAAQA
ncbi:MAG: 30S ribosomal protein S16 [Myxococcales bacterium]|nr:30S ribosomal protein S16 [Myxococcales bacterium]